MLSWRKPSSEKEAMKVLKERVKAAVAPIDDFLKEVKKISGTENEFRAARGMCTHHACIHAEPVCLSLASRSLVVEVLVRIGHPLRACRVGYLEP